METRPCHSFGLRAKKGGDPADEFIAAAFISAGALSSAWLILGAVALALVSVNDDSLERVLTLTGGRRTRDGWCCSVTPTTSESAPCASKVR